MKSRGFLCCNLTLGLYPFSSLKQRYKEMDLAKSDICKMKDLH
jgi:hypothetical protein